MDNPRSTAGFMNRVLPFGSLGCGQTQAALQFLESFERALRVDGGGSGPGLRDGTPEGFFFGDTPRLRKAPQKISALLRSLG